MRTASGARVVICQGGNVPLVLPSGNVLELSQVGYCPQLTVNLISASALVNDGYNIVIERDGAVIYGSEIDQQAPIAYASLFG